MWRRWAALIMLVLVAAGPLSSPARESVKPRSKNHKAQERLDQAWNALAEDMRISDLDRAIAHLEKARDLDPDNPEILAELAHERFMRGYQTPPADPARKENFLKGKQAAQKALSIRESAGSHYWYAVNLGVLNEDAGILAQTSVFSEITEHVNWVSDRDPGYRYGIVARFWVGVIVNAPPMVMRLVGRDQGEVYQELEAAIKDEPRYLENLLCKAEYLHYLGREDEARAALDKLRQADPAALPAEKAMNRFAQRRGRQLWAEWTGQKPDDL